MNQKKKQNKSNITKQLQKIFKTSTTKKTTISRSKSKSKSPPKAANNSKDAKISNPCKTNARKSNTPDKAITKSNVRKSNTPDNPIYNKRNEFGTNHIRGRETHYYNTKTPSPVPQKIIKSYKDQKAKIGISKINTNNISLNDQNSSSYGTSSCSEYSSKTKIVKALNELNTEINQIYNKNKQIKRQVKQSVCLTTKNNGSNKSNNNNSLRLHTSDLKHSPLLFKNKKYIGEEYDKMNSKETKESNNSYSNYNSNNKSIREPCSNYCFSFEDSRCSNSKGIQTIEEVHFAFISLIQKAKNMIRLQENISNKDDNAFDTVMKCEEREVFNNNSYN